MAGMAAGVRSRIQIVFALVVLLAGAALIAYPYVSDYLCRLNQVEVVQSQAAAVDSQDEEDLRREQEASSDYNERLRVDRVAVTDPFDPSNKPVTAQEYEQRCNIANDGVMASLVIPKADVTVPIYHGTGEEALRKGAGHLEATSLPVGGLSTHCAVAGHNGLPSVRIFDDIGRLVVGDYFVVQVLGEDHAYRVTSIETVLPDQTESLVIEEGKDLMTLITCTPYGVNTHRLLVHAERCEVPDEWYARDKADAENVSVGSERLIVPFTLAGAAAALSAVAARAAWTRHRNELARRRSVGAFYGNGGPHRR